MEEFTACDKCQNGYLYTSEKGEEIVTICDCLELYQYRVKVTNALIKGGIGSEMLSFNIDWFQGNRTNVKKVEKYIRHFAEDYRSTNLYFVGANHTQKSTLAKYVGSELIQRGFTAEFIVMNNLLNILMDEKFNKENTDKIKRCENADLLIIDEIFDPLKTTIYKSNYQLPFLDTFLRNRFEKTKKANIFTANMSLDNIDAVYGSSIISLVKRNIGENEFSFYDIFDPKKFENSLWEKSNKKL